MDRRSCEQAITSHMEKIIEVLHQYAPNCHYLSLAYIADEDGESIMFNNDYSEADCDTPISYHSSFDDAGVISYTQMLDWIAEHGQVKEDFINAFPNMASKFEEDN